MYVRIYVCMYVMAGSLKVSDRLAATAERFELRIVCAECCAVESHPPNRLRRHDGSH